MGASVDTSGASGILKASGEPEALEASADTSEELEALETSEEDMTPGVLEASKDGVRSEALDVAESTARYRAV